MQNNVYKTGIKNIIYSLFSQGITFCLSIVTGLVLPKVMGVSDYGYWQIYLFYVGYVMIFCMGFNDGLYLRYGSYNYDQLPFAKLRSAMRIFILAILLITCLLAALSFIEKDPNKIFIFCLTSINLIIVGINGTLLTILQFTNRIKLNSFITIANKTIFAMLILIFLFVNEIDFKRIIFADIITKVVLLCFNIYKSKELFLGETHQFDVGLLEYWNNIQVGIKLMLANIASSLLIGIGRFIVERYMSIEAYSLYSFASTITAFALLFINASSLSMYPLLKRIPKEKLSIFYVDLNKLLSVILFFILVAYYPLSYLIRLQFENYIDVLDYLFLLFITIISQGKMQFLINTYYKVLGEEKAMLFANMSGIIVAIIVIVPAFIVTKSIYSIVIGTTITLVWRCYTSEIYLKRKMKISGHKNFLIEILMIISFVLCVIFNSQNFGIILYLLITLAYAFYNRKIVLDYTKKVLRLIH